MLAALFGHAGTTLAEPLCDLCLRGPEARALQFVGERQQAIALAHLGSFLDGQISDDAWAWGLQADHALLGQEPAIDAGRAREFAEAEQRDDCRGGGHAGEREPPE